MLVLFPEVLPLHSPALANVLPLDTRMAIMWDPPAERPSLEPTPAELAWKRWLMEALVATNDDGSTPGERRDKSDPPTETLTPAA